jgi:outer membrane protein OmpA-like peptidoglycan-associated protein
MKRALLLLASLLLAPGCRAPKTVPAPLSVKAESDPSPAILSLRGKALGPTPITLQLDNLDEVPLVQAHLNGQAPVEQRVRFLPGGQVELKFLFGEGRSDMAKALGLNRVLVFEYAAGLTFEVDQADLRASTFPLLNRQAKLLNGSFKDILVNVCGHTDSTGSQDHNLDLSVRRAKAVLEYLASQGVAKERLRPQGFAAAYPLAPNATEEGRALNRRTEVVLAQ